MFVTSKMIRFLLFMAVLEFGWLAPACNKLSQVSQQYS